MTSELWTLLGVNLALALVLMTLAALPSLRTKDPSYIDGVWGLGFVAVAVASLLQARSGGFGDPARKGLLVGLCAVWGLRLAGYLFRRWRWKGPDPRYQDMLARRRGGSAGMFLLTRVFLTQALVLVLTSLPVQLGQVYGDRLTWWNGVGVALAAFGIAFESVADGQLAAFTSVPSHHGQVMDRGLWRYSRHPNYFGEACTWWGLGLLAWSNAVTASALIGPAVITFFLLRVSGVGLLEKGLRQTKPAYADYVATTSAFVPLPKRVPR